MGVQFVKLTTNFVKTKTQRLRLWFLIESLRVFQTDLTNSARYIKFLMLLFSFCFNRMNWFDFRMIVFK